MFEKLLEDIKQYDKIVIHRHKNPDGDALGSQIGLKNLILDNCEGKEVRTVGDEAGRYAFMEQSVMDEVPDSFYDGALAIVLDTSGANLISDDRYNTAAKTARVDHHLFLEKICDDEIQDQTFESCCGMIAFFAKESGLKLSKLSATSLYTGMVTDSGRFRYDNTNARTFQMASFLMSAGIDTNDLYNKLYSEDFEAIKRKALFVMKIRFTEHRCAYIYNTAKEVEELGMSTFNVSRGMVGTMGDIKGVDIWVNFTEAPEGVLCEIRSSKYNVCPIAMKYGGGGHEKACGATVPDKETAMKMLADLDAMLIKD
ncbi:MAG: bifunctional oligoribonuclease/PAP phosphatase NrnA [Lachnospiraceae bacterium]|nr:bifunctional oligoribonuclease/PAP phosphatase NrnA [Lachnospiraceae bacterium]